MSTTMEPITPRASRSELLTVLAASLPRCEGEPPAIVTTVNRWLDTWTDVGLLLYSDDETAEIAEKAQSLKRHATRVFVAINNNRRDYPVVNGLQLKRRLDRAWKEPDRDQLIEKLRGRRTAHQRSER